MTLEGQEAIGVGLASMQERIRQIGGVFTLDSATNKGTTLKIRLPV